MSADFRTLAVWLSFLAALCLTLVGSASYEGTYYNAINRNAVDEELKDELHKLISVKTVISYDKVWAAFAEVDRFLPGWPCSQNTSHIPDIYSSTCWSPEKNLPTGGECGNYQKEGDCFNREHSWPSSWFGAEDAPGNAYTDIFLLYPSDGYVNSKRGNTPLGDVDPSSVTYTSSNGSKVGKCLGDTDGYTGACFEPPLQLKGDLARSYFYISVCYMDVFSCCVEPAVNKWRINSWEETVLRKWHELDPVDDAERARIEAVFARWQHNRNPFVDHPEWVSQINDF